MDDPDTGKAEVERLVKRIDGDDLPASLPILRRLVELRPGVLHFRTGLALASMEAGDVPGAEAAARASLALRENDIGLSLLGQILVSRGEHEEGERLLRRLLERDPEDTDALSGLAWSLARRERHRQAAEVWGRLLRLEPADAAARAERAWSLLCLGDHHGAILELLESVDLVETRGARAWLGTAYLRMGLIDRAHAEAQAAAAVEPADGEECDQLAWLYEELGRKEEARRERQRRRARFGEPGG